MNDKLFDTAAIILCGGKSRRMGRPKAWLPFGPDEVMLQRVVRRVDEVVSLVVVVAAPDQELPSLSDRVAIVRDEVSDRGPLQGLAAGLAALPAEMTFAYATATDVPFLRPCWIRRLRETIADYDLAMPLVSGFHQPLAALYRTVVVGEAIAELLVEDRLRPVYLIERVKSRIMSEDEFRDIDPSLDTLRNLNTPEDYAHALADFAMQARSDRDEA